MCIAVGGLDFKNAIAQLENGNIESAAAKVVYRDGLLFLLILVEAVSKAGCRRLVDNSLDFQPGDLAGILGSLALSVVKICRNGDNSFRNRLAEIILGCFFSFSAE